MKIASIDISRFRSIDSIELQSVGGFNVLIGKNNSGKSNILSAVDTFFTCIQDGQISTLQPPFGKSIDFFDKKVEEPIQITVSFVLTLAERDALLQDIVTEAPQMQNATEGISSRIILLATVVITSQPAKFAYVSKLAVRNSVPPLGAQPVQDRMILEIGKEPASELYSQLSREFQTSSDIELLKQIHDDDRLSYLISADKDRIRRSVVPSLRELSSLSPDLRRSVEDSINEANSPDDLKRMIQLAITTKAEEFNAIREESLKTTVRTFTGAESNIPNYVQKLIKKISEIKVLHLKDRREPIGNEEAERILKLKTQRGGLDKLRDIQEPVETLLGVQIDAFASGTETQYQRRRILMPSEAELDVDNFLVAVNGSGIKEALRVILDVEFEKPDILLVEEPEIHLHPALETSMMRYLKKLSAYCQVFLTTHSTNFLDTAEMKNVYLVSKATSTQVQHINLEEAEVQVPKELGLRLSSLFMFDRLVFVEGESDESILREWALTTKVNFSQFNVGFVPMEGVHNFAHYAQEKTLNLLSKRQVKILFLIDRDEREDTEITRLQERCGDNAKLTVLSRREIENYLICPRAIAAFISLKCQKNHGQSDQHLPTEEEIKDAISHTAEQLKQFTLDKRVAKIISKPFYPSRERLFQQSQDTSILDRVNTEVDSLIERLEAIKTNLDTVHDEQINYIDQNWNRDKERIVPGDVLLDKVCQRFGVRFKKERDGPILAALMLENEIDSEIKQIIREIVE